MTLKAKEKSQPLSGKKRVALWMSAGCISVLLGVSLAFFSMYPQLMEAMGVRNSSKDSEQFDSIAFRYYQAGEYDKAITLLKFGVETYKEIGSERLLGDNFKHIADCYRKKSEYREAAVYYEKAYRIYKKLKVYDSLSLSCLEEYAETLEKLGQTELAKKFKDRAAKRRF